MSHDEPQLSFEQPRSAFGTWLGVVLLFAVFALFVWVVVGAMPRGDKYEEKRAAARIEKLKSVTDEAATLHTYAWVDKAKGIVRIPIDRAMEMSVAELAQKKPAPAGPIATPAAPAPAAPATAPTVAPKPAADSSPAASTPAAQPPASPNDRGRTPVQTPPGTALPVPGSTP